MLLYSLTTPQRLNLEAAHVKYDKSGIIINDHLQTSNSSIYAVGDVCTQYKFTVCDLIARIQSIVAYV